MTFVISAVKTIGSGGGDVILNNLLTSSSSLNNVVVIVPKNVVIDNVRTIAVPDWIRYLGLYELLIDFILFFKKIKPEKVLNLGDIPLLTRHFQIYYYDWYFLEVFYTKGIGNVNGFGRKIKCLLFRALHVKINIVVCQTPRGENFINKYVNKPTLVSLPFTPQQVYKSRNVQSFIYPASASQYKRHDKLAHFARNNPEVIIYTTLSTEHFHEYYETVDNVVNCGWLDTEEMNRSYQKVDALIMLSDFESLSLPLLEAVSFGLPIFYDGQEFVTDIIEGGYLLDEYRGNEVYWAARVKSSIKAINLIDYKYDDLF